MSAQVNQQQSIGHSIYSSPDYSLPEQYGTFNAYKSKGVIVGKYIQTANSDKLYHTSGTDRQGRYIPPHTRYRGIIGRQENPQILINDEQEIVKLLELEDSGRIVRGQKIYTRRGFIGSYTLQREADNTVSVFFSGGFHKSSSQIRMRPQTFHHGRWDKNRSYRTGPINKPPKNSRAKNLTGGRGGSTVGSGAVAPGSNTSGRAKKTKIPTQIKTNQRNSSGLDKIKLPKVQVLTEEPDKKQKSKKAVSTKQPSSSPKQLADPPKMPKTNEKKTPGISKTSPNANTQTTKKPQTPSGRPPGQKSNPNSKNSSKNDSDSSNSKSSNQPKKMLNKQTSTPKIAGPLNHSLKEIWKNNKFASLGDVFDMASKFLKKNNVNPKLKNTAPQNTVKQAPKMVQVSRPKTPEEKKIPEAIIKSDQKLLKEYNYCKDQVKRKRDEYNRYRRSNDYLSAKNRASSASEYAHSLQKKNDKRGWYNPAKHFNYSLQFAYEAAAEAQLEYSERQDILNSYMNREFRARSELKKARLAITAFRKKHSQYKFAKLD